MDQPDENPYANMAHKARLAYAQKLRLTGCTCHPHLAAAVVKNIYDELVPVVNLIAHEDRCQLGLNERRN